ncbi:hypothetical protein P1X14_03710 [Sphingomonas sp. AOB5]|uniref:hypothetical protein n=1 Tax=Sphingomonas sp. AOB5 TaxID=3034017 RepID=UPI0023F894C6|nr:hypothetical protein [Sphingomonas sp. AOB5]MDF7774342.1 hypothetical protein [Sphingomonas sp. AOB5]
MKSILIAAAAALLTLTATPAMAQAGEQANPAGPWKHNASGVSFPQLNGKLSRDKVNQYDTAGNDVSSTYFRDGADGTRGLVAVYVYPATSGGCAADWSAVKNEVTGGGGAILSEDRFTSPSGRTASAAYHASARFPTGGEPDPTLKSSIYLYCVPGGKWLVKYYATWRGPANFDGEAMTLLKAFTWPDGFNR